MACAITRARIRNPHHRSLTRCKTRSKNFFALKFVKELDRISRSYLYIHHKQCAQNTVTNRLPSVCENQFAFRLPNFLPLVGDSFPAETSPTRSRLYVIVANHKRHNSIPLGTSLKSVSTLAGGKWMLSCTRTCLVIRTIHPVQLFVKIATLYTPFSETKNKRYCGIIHKSVVLRIQDL